MGLWAEIKPLLRDRLFPVRIAPTKEGNPSPPVLFQMATGYWVSQAIYVAAKLGIADLLKDGPQSCVALATATKTDTASLFRLMRALASVGIFSHVRRDCFALSRLAESLQTDTPGSLKAMVMTIPQWSPQNRPCVDVSKPAMWNGLRQVLFYLAAVVLARPDSVAQLRVKLMLFAPGSRLAETSRAENAGLAPKESAIETLGRWAVRADWAKGFRLVSPFVW